MSTSSAVTENYIVTVNNLSV